MNFNQHEKVILSIYRNKSFTKAAAELEISQPAMSAAINKIENKIGIQIFKRRQTPIVPTEEGMIYIEYLQKFQKEYKECFSKIEDVIENRNRSLVIGAPVAYATMELPEVITNFNKKNQDCKITIRVATLPELIEMAEGGIIDCFISTSQKLDSNFAIEKVRTEKMYLCVPKDWDINDKFKKYQVDVNLNMESNIGNKINWKEFDGCQLISLEEKQPLQQDVNMFLTKENLRLNNRVVVDQVLLAVELATQGLGMTFTSDVAIRWCKNTDNLYLYPLPDYMKDRDIYIAYNTNNYVSKMCKEFISMLKNNINR